MIEKHFCITRDDRTVDSAFSMSKQEFTDMVEQVENAKKAIGHVSYELTEKEVKGLDGRRSLLRGRGHCRRRNTDSGQYTKY